MGRESIEQLERRLDATQLVRAIAKRAERSSVAVSSPRALERRTPSSISASAAR